MADHPFVAVYCFELHVRDGHIALDDFWSDADARVETLSTGVGWAVYGHRTDRGKTTVFKAEAAIHGFKHLISGPHVNSVYAGHVGERKRPIIFILPILDAKDRVYISSDYTVPALDGMLAALTARIASIRGRQHAAEVPEDVRKLVLVATAHGVRGEVHARVA